MYDTTDGESFKNFSFNLIFPRFLRKGIEKYFEEEEKSTDIENERVEELEYCSGTKEVIKNFIRKCVISLVNPSVCAFRQCGHRCFCGDCYTSLDEGKKIMCVVCGT